MPTPVSGSVSYQTPSTFAALEVLTTAEYNKVVKDVAYFRARPYTLVWQTTAPSTATLVASTDLSAANGRTLFATANGGTAGSSISTSAVGTISLGSDGRLITPSTLAGLYRVKCQMMVSSDNGSHARVSAILYDSSGTQVGSVPGIWADTATDHNALSTVTFTMPFNVAGSAFGNVNGVKFIGQYIGSSVISVVVNDDNVHGPSSTPKQFNTFAEIEYLGTSTGAY